MIFKVLSSIFYCIMDSYVCVDNMFCPKIKIHVISRGQGFENRPYNGVSGIGIPEILMNTILCHGFVNNTKSAVILSRSSKLVDYFLQKYFAIHKNNSNTLKNVPLRVK